VEAENPLNLGDSNPARVNAEKRKKNDSHHLDWMVEI